jgi:hypothetical protein
MHDPSQIQQARLAWMFLQPAVDQTRSGSQIGRLNRILNREVLLGSQTNRRGKENNRKSHG